MYTYYIYVLTNFRTGC